MVTILQHNPFYTSKNTNVKTKKKIYLNLLLVKWKNHNIKKFMSCLNDNYFEEKAILKILKKIVLLPDYSF